MERRAEGTDFPPIFLASGRFNFGKFEARAQAKVWSFNLEDVQRAESVEKVLLWLDLVAEFRGKNVKFWRYSNSAHGWTSKTGILRLNEQHPVMRQNVPKMNSAGKGGFCRKTISLSICKCRCTSQLKFFQLVISSFSHFWEGNFIYNL